MDIDDRGKLEQYFPNLKSTPFSITSESTRVYNCIAWAANDDQNWWEPDPYNQYYWPPNIQREYSLQALIQVFVLFGYEPCESQDSEPGFERVAIYVDQDGVPTHAARKLSSGLWTSKLGTLEDIEHTLEGLENSRYGKVGQILRRPV
jgi:hypothetical protein